MFRPCMMRVEYRENRRSLNPRRVDLALPRAAYRSASASLTGSSDKQAFRPRSRAYRALAPPWAATCILETWHQNRTLPSYRRASSKYRLAKSTKSRMATSTERAWPISPTVALFIDTY